jgi:hypothetical protein
MIWHRYTYPWNIFSGFFLYKKIRACKVGLKSCPLNFQGAIDTAETITLVSLTPQKQSPTFQWHRGDHLHRDLGTTEISTFFCCCGHWHRRTAEMIYGCRWHRRGGLCGVIDTAEKRCFLNISANTKPFLKQLQPLSQRPRWVWLMKKTKGQKSCDTVTLSNSIYQRNENL